MTSVNAIVPLGSVKEYTLYLLKLALQVRLHTNYHQKNGRPKINRIKLHQYSSLNTNYTSTMASEDWRKIDIDALEPEYHLSAAELVPDLPQVSQSQISSVAQQVRSHLSSGQFQQALELALDNAPYIADLLQTKELHAKTVFEILCSIKNNNNISELGQFVKNLNQEQQDTLIKYLYKSMSESYGQKQGGLLLNWFEKTVEVTGVGAIARYMTDRRTV